MEIRREKTRSKQSSNKTDDAFNSLIIIIFLITMLFFAVMK